MIEIATDAILVLAVVVLALSVLIVLVRASRGRLRRRQARLAQRPRLALLELVAEGGADEAGARRTDALVAMPRREWRAAEPSAIALLGKVRGEAALVEALAAAMVGL